MKRELKEVLATVRNDLGYGGNSSIPYEEGTESWDSAPQVPCGRRVTAAFPMKRELKGRVQERRKARLRRVTAAFPMKRELKVRLSAEVQPYRAG